VGLGPGRGTVDAPVPGAVAPLSVAGPVPALAPLAAGGAGWRLRGARVRGSRLRLVRLLRARRAPVGLGDLAAARVAVDPALLLAALAAAVPPALTAGQRFGVAYDLGDRALEVRAADGAPIAVSTGRTTRVAAIVHTDPAAVLPLLAGTPAGARVTGDPVAVELLHGWFDRARGVAVR
jgi:hypothetical protein